MGGRQVKLFLVDGTPGGLVTAEITNWTGHVVSGPRSRLPALLAREEAGRAGVYLLLGDDPGATGGVRYYVGEAHELRTRLRDHLADPGRGFWDRMVLVTSKDADLTAAQCRYLKARLISLAHAADRSEAENRSTPPLPPLPEADASDMDQFIEQLQLVLPLLGVSLLRGRSTAARPAAVPGSAPATSPEFHLELPHRGISARAAQVDGEFMVMVGSVGAAEVRSGRHAASTAGAHEAYRELQEKLLADGSLQRRDGVVVFARDVVFSSPSTAGAIVTGRSCDGRATWRTREGLTFGDWERQGADGTGAALSGPRPPA